MSAVVKVLFMGSTKYSLDMLCFLDSIPHVEICGVCSISKEFHISYSESPVVNSNYADLGAWARQRNVPHRQIDGAKGNRMGDSLRFVKELSPDVILVLGWYYMIPKSMREAARHGAWGIHASLLPRYAGGAPLVWAIINGERSTGVTLFRMDDGVDDGDIIIQKEFPIDPSHTIKEVYESATGASKQLLDEVFSRMEEIRFTPQQKDAIEVWPQRSPDDGEIDISWSAGRMYDFIRAQAPPYPGAFIRTTDGKKLVIEKARVDED